MNRKTRVLSARALEKWQQSGEGLVALLERNLDFARWGFHISYTDFTIDGTPVIYDSEWCRVDFRLHHRGRTSSDDELYITYGRLHAPNTEPFMTWNGERCHCWHNNRWLPILFMDGLSSQEAVNFVGLPPVAAQFKQSEMGKKLGNTYHTEYVLQLESAIWNHYGQRLFELFDFRRPELWTKYTHFVTQYYVEFYRIHPRVPIRGDTSPPPDRIC